MTGGTVVAAVNRGTVTRAGMTAGGVTGGSAVTAARHGGPRGARRHRQRRGDRHPRAAVNGG